MTVKDRNISELIPAEYNPRYIKEADFEQLKASIQRFDAVEPVVVNMHPERKNIIISGHQRIKAAKALGMDTFPCVELSLTADQEKELNIRMNKNTGNWDWDALADFFEVDELTDWGFSEDELFGGGTGEEPEAQEDDLEMPDELTDEATAKDATIKITFSSPDHVDDALPEIESIIEKYHGAYLSISAGEL